jgi:CO/xanthine dehydrogenase Mo-binding subunit
MMTGLIPERDGSAFERPLSRRTVVKGGGALVVTFSTLGAVFGAKSAKAAGGTFDSNGPYDSQQLDSWLAVHGDNTVSMKLGMIELGQGSTTGLLMIAAEELNCDMSQMRMIANDTDVTPNQGGTYGSQAVHVGGMQTRAAAAAAHQTLLSMASAQLGVPAAGLSVSKGVVSGGGKQVTYGQLIGDKLFNVAIPDSYKLAAVPSFFGGPPTAGPGLNPGEPGSKPVGSYTLVGTNPGPPRIDIPAKVAGTYTYVHNIRVPGMLHGRLVRPRGQGAYGDGTNPKVVSVDAGSISHIPGAKVLQKGNFIGVVAPLEYDAIQAAAQLKVTWASMPSIPGVGNIWSQMRKQDATGQATLIPYNDLGNVDGALPGAAKTVAATYSMHYNGHLPIGPTCVVADVTSGGARIFCNSQDCYNSRGGIQAALALAGLNLPANKIRVTYVEGSSVYGTAPYDDGNQSAAVLSYLAGAPVRLQFMRWDEHGWDHYNPAQLMDVRGGVDANGNVVATDFTHYSIQFYGIEAGQQELGAEPGPLGFNFIDATNMGAQYKIPNQRVTLKQLPLIDQYFSSSFLRAPLAPASVFAFEGLIDELAHAANMDPVAFRLQNISNNTFESQKGIPLTWDRWRNALTEVAKISKWQSKVAASKLDSGNIVSGRGVAIGGFAGTMAGIVADIKVNKTSGKISVTNLYGAQDTGLSVYLGGVENQAVGSMTQGLSRAMLEAVNFDKSHVTSLDWVSYPILRFKDSPPITFSVVQRKDIPSVDSGTVAANGVLATGSGEPPTAPIAAAVANAFFDATGIRMRQAPFTSARVREVLKASA